MSDLNNELKRQSQAAVEPGSAEGEEPAEPNEGDKGGGADKSKALGQPGLGDRGRVSQDDNKYD